MKTRKRELAKVGVFGSIDNPTIVTEKDLKEIVATFPDIKTAPVKLGGHWEAPRPRLANVIKVAYNDTTQTLYGDIEENDVLSAAVDAGFYPDVSIGAKQRASDGMMYLHHLAYLGDEPPAIKDLEKEIADTLDNSEQIAAGDTADSTVRVFPGTTDKRLYLSDKPFAKENTNRFANTSENNPHSGASSVLHKEASMTEEEITAIQAENERLKKENETKEKMLSDSFAKAKEAEKASLKKAMEGKLPEAEQQKLLQLADSFDSEKTILLSDGDAKRTVSPISVLAEVFGKIALPVEPGVLNLSDVGNEPAAHEELKFSAI